MTESFCNIFRTFSHRRSSCHTHSLSLLLRKLNPIEDSNYAAKNSSNNVVVRILELSEYDQTIMCVPTIQGIFPFLPNILQPKKQGCNRYVS